MEISQKKDELSKIDPITDYETWCRTAYDSTYFTHFDFSLESTMPIHREFVKLALSFFPNDIKKVLVAAGGQGTMVKILKDLGYDAYGVDISEYAVKLARKRFPDIADKMFIMDIKNMDLFENNGFDLIISGSTLEHIPWEFMPSLAKEFARISKYIFCMAAFDHRYDNDYTHMPIHPMMDYLEVFSENFEISSQKFEAFPSTLPGERWDFFCMKRKGV